MSLQSQIAFLHGLMNQDSDLQYVRTDGGQVILRTNLRTNSKDGHLHANEKIIGNTLISAGLPAGENRVIGWCNHYKENAVIYFIYNEFLNHCIFVYYVNAKQIKQLWYAEPQLDFENSIIRACVVDGILYWVNGSKEPKSFKIEWALNRIYYPADPSKEKYTAADEPFLDNIFPLIKRPPRFCPTNCRYVDDPSYEFNNLRKRQFQFKYCYEYADNQRSAWSSISKIPLPTNEIGGNGEWDTNITHNNVISLDINSGARQVKKILVAARESNPHNTGSFFIFKEIEKYSKDGVQQIEDDSTLTVDFYNNVYIESIDTDINNRYCDDVPLAAKDILLLDDKYLAMACPVKNYDAVDLDYAFSAVQKTVDVESSSYSYSGKLVKQLWRDEVHDEWVISKLWTICIPKIFPQNVGITLSFSHGDPDKPNEWTHFTHTIITGEAPTMDYPEDYRNEFLEEIRNIYGQWSVDNLPNSNDACSNWTGIIFQLRHSYMLHDLKITISQSINQYLPVSKTLKRGQFHPFGIIYNDGFGRYNVVMANNEFYSPLATSALDATKYVMCEWSINHTPPVWAKTYRWCYIKNKSYLTFVYLYKLEVVPVGEKYLLKINQKISEIKESFPNSLIQSYVWENGDRIRSIGSNESYEILSDYTIPAEDEFHDDVTGYLIDGDLRQSGSLTGIVEIYRQNPEPQSTIYQEIGEEFEILDAGTANRRHQGQTMDQIVGVRPAVGVFDFGDVYFRYRLNNDGIPYAIEDPHLSDYYTSDSIDLGRAGAKIDTHQETLNRVVRGENHLENTLYNILNVFLFDADYFSASDVWGEITGIEQVGDVLKIIQPHKETSVYIGKLLVKEANGEDIFIDSSQVFGTKNDYIETRGSTYRNSIVRNDRQLYYFDESTGEIIRSSANGQLPISSHYWMNSWFEDKAREIREYVGEKDVIISCDNAYGDVVVSFIIGNNIETIIFREKEGESGWMCFATYRNDADIPENFAFQGDTFISFMRGHLYLHNVGTANRFYNKQHGCNIEFVVNLPPYVSKSFSNIRISTTTNVWDVEFNIPPKYNYGSQKSILKPTIMSWENNVLRSDIHSNIINRAGLEDIELLYRGHDMIGELMKVKLSNSDSSSVILGEIEVSFNINS